MVLLPASASDMANYIYIFAIWTLLLGPMNGNSRGPIATGPPVE